MGRVVLGRRGRRGRRDRVRSLKYLWVLCALCGQEKSQKPIPCFPCVPWLVQTAAHPGGGWEGLASMPPIYIGALESQKLFKLPKSFGTRRFEWPAGRQTGRTLAAIQPVVGLSPVSGAAARGGPGAQSPSLVLVGLAFAAPSCAYTPARARSVRGSPVLLLLNPSPFRTRPHAYAYAGAHLRARSKTGNIYIPVYVYTVYV